MFSEDFSRTINEIIDMLLEPAEWPQEGDKFWVINMAFVVDTYHYDPSSNYIKETILGGNCFRTKKEAIKARNKIRRILNET